MWNRHLDATTEERKSAEEISNVDENWPVFVTGKHGCHMDANGNDIKKYDDDIDWPQTGSITCGQCHRLNILLPSFLPISLLQKFSNLKFKVFANKNTFTQETQCKMLVKLTNVVTFVNILLAACGRIFFCQKNTNLNSN